jgi:hypothetical protein
VAVYGIPISSASAAEQIDVSVAEALYREEKPKRRERDETWDRARVSAETQVAPIKGALGGQSGGISLGDAAMRVTSTGEVVFTPVIRVPIESVDAWFAGHFDTQEKGSGGSGLFGFVSVPLE